MGHADDQFFATVVGREIGQFGENGDSCLRAFQGKALLPDEAPVEEVLELFGLEKILQNPKLFLIGKSGEGCSMRSWSQVFSSVRWMYMYSEPILPQ